jgi:hypothetical protein
LLAAIVGSIGGTTDIVVTAKFVQLGALLISIPVIVYVVGTVGVTIKEIPVKPPGIKV